MIRLVAGELFQSAGYAEVVRAAVEERCGAGCGRM